MLSLGFGKINPVNLLRDVFLNFLTNKTMGFTDEHLRTPTGKYESYGMNSLSFMINFV